jgi:hypothetical protein
MTVVSQKTFLRGVKRILGSGNGTVEFAIRGEEDYYTWNGVEDADWDVEDFARVEHIEEDRFIMYPANEKYPCEIDASEEEFNHGPVRCYCR